MFEITCPTHQHQTLTPVMLYFVQIDCLLGDFGAKKKSFQNVINNLFPLNERSIETLHVLDQEIMCWVEASNSLIAVVLHFLKCLKISSSR